MSKLKHYDNLGTARFVTIACFRRLPLLADEREKRILLCELDAARQKHGFKLFAYVVMPNHTHLVLLPPDGSELGKVIGEIKARSARQIISSWKIEGNDFLDQLEIVRHNIRKHAFWIPRCFDHNCRTGIITREKIVYCHMNPVKSGLVADPADWIWSSYRFYQGETGGLIDLDAIEL